MLRTWKMGLVGVGGLNRSQAYVHHPRIQVIAVCDVAESALQRAGDMFGLPESSSLRPLRKSP